MTDRSISMIKFARAAARLSAVLGGVFLLAHPGSALAHAHLRSAQPPVDGSVHQGVQDVRITYSEAVEPGFCQVSVIGPGDGAVAAAPPAVDPADPKVLVVHLSHPLDPGTYRVDWHATAADTHKTEGSYRFTVTP